MKSARLPLVIGASVGVVVLMGLAAFFVVRAQKPESLQDRASYTIGAQFGRSLVQQNLTLDSAMVAKGIRDAIDGKEFVLTEDEMQSAMIKLNEDRKKATVEEADKNAIAAR